ncbi:DUF6000 family protein [Streptomyces sp. NPDC055186]
MGKARGRPWPAPGFHERPADCPRTGGHSTEAEVASVTRHGRDRLLRLDAHLGTHHADRSTQPDGLWGQWVNALVHLRDQTGCTPDEQRRRAGLQCEFANGWSRL